CDTQMGLFYGITFGRRIGLSGSAVLRVSDKGHGRHMGPVKKVGRLEDLDVSAINIDGSMSGSLAAEVIEAAPLVQARSLHAYKVVCCDHLAIASQNLFGYTPSKPVRAIQRNIGRFRR